MGNRKQIANSEEKKSRKSHRLPGCQRGLSNGASGGDRRHHRVRDTPYNADTCPNTRNGGKSRVRPRPPSANLEHKLNRSSLESHRRLPFNRPELANNQKQKKANHRFYLKTQNQIL